MSAWEYSDDCVKPQPKIIFSLSLVRLPFPRTRELGFKNFYRNAYIVKHPHVFYGEIFIRTGVQKMTLPNLAPQLLPSVSLISTSGANRAVHRTSWLPKKGHLRFLHELCIW